MAFVFVQGHRHGRLEPQCGALTAAALTGAGWGGVLERGLDHAGVALTCLLAWILHVAVERPSMRLAGRIRRWRGERG